MSLPGQFYAKNTSDITLIPDPRAALSYPFNAGSWTDLRVAFSVSATSESDPNAAPAEEAITVTNYPNWITMGLKDAATTDLPGQSSSSRFCGLLHFNSQSRMNNAIAGSSFMSLASGVWDGTTLTKVNVAGQLGWTHANLIGNTNYSEVVLIRFELLNPGTGSQQIRIGWSFGGGHSVSVGGLRAQLASFAPVNGVSDTFTFLGTVPNAVFFRWPFAASRARIHALVVEKFA